MPKYRNKKTGEVGNCTAKELKAMTTNPLTKHKFEAFAGDEPPKKITPEKESSKKETKPSNDGRNNTSGKPDKGS